jgi:hypothetical protein
MSFPKMITFPIIPQELPCIFITAIGKSQGNTRHLFRNGSQTHLLDIRGVSYKSTISPLWNHALNPIPFT